MVVREAQNQLSKSTMAEKADCTLLQIPTKEDKHAVFTMSVCHFIVIVEIQVTTP